MSFPIASLPWVQTLPDMVTKHPETQAIREDAIFKFSCRVSWAISWLTSASRVLEVSALSSVSFNFLQVPLATSAQDLSKNWLPGGARSIATPGRTFRDLPQRGRSPWCSREHLSPAAVGVFTNIPLPRLLLPVTEDTGV